MNKAELVREGKSMMRLTKIGDEIFYVSLFIVNTVGEFRWNIGLPGFIDHIHLIKINIVGIHNNSRLSFKDNKY